MHGKRFRPAHCEPGSMEGREPELWARVCLSRERLASSELANSGQAWRLWSACVGATEGYTREADTIYVMTLAQLAGGVDRKAASQILRRFGELGVMAWKAEPRGSHRISELGLPPLNGARRPMNDLQGRPTPHEDGASTDLHAPLQSNELRVLSYDSVEGVDTGTHHSSPSLSASPGDGLGSDVARHSEDWEADELDAAIRAAYADPTEAKVLARFGEAEPAAVTDTEAHLMRRRRRR